MTKTEWFKILLETFANSDLRLRLGTVYHLNRILQGDEFDFIVIDNAGGTVFEIWVDNIPIWTPEENEESVWVDKLRHTIRDFRNNVSLKAYQLDGKFISRQTPYKYRNNDWIAWKNE